MSDYARPAIAQREFRDATGEIINYGNRWGMGFPPDDSYSVTSNLERFEPLHDVVQALVDWLADTYDVTVEENAAFAKVLQHQPPHRVHRVVRVSPADARAAPLTFVTTEFPSVFVHFGCLRESHIPPCGCDACDETWEQGADDLEFIVRAVVAGGLSERITGVFRPTYHHALSLPDEGGVSGSSQARDPASRARVKAAHKRLRRVGSWRPWPRRSNQA